MNYKCNIQEYSSMSLKHVKNSLQLLFFVLLYYIDYIGVSYGQWYWFYRYITGNILRSVNDIPIVKPGISLYRRSLYRGSEPTLGTRGNTRLNRNIHNKTNCEVWDSKPQSASRTSGTQGILPNTFYYNFCWANDCWSLYRNTVIIPKIVKPGFHSKLF